MLYHQSVVLKILNLLGFEPTASAKTFKDVGGYDTAIQVGDF